MAEVTDAGVEITATVKTAGRTGVEMEALTAVSVAGLAVIDMIKAIDRAAVITDVRVLAKSGGRRGDWTREDRRSERHRAGDHHLDPGRRRRVRRHLRARSSSTALIELGFEVVRARSWCRTATRSAPRCARRSRPAMRW